MIARTEADYKGLMEIGKIIAGIRDAMVQATTPGMTTKQLDELAGKLFAQHGAVSAPIEMYGFPGYTCISVNEEVAHGIPGKRVIAEGDLVNIDVSGSKNRYYADTGISFVVGKGDQRLFDLCTATQEIFNEGLSKFVAGTKLNNVGRAVENAAKKRGYKILRNLTGHGIGRSLRDAPDFVHNHYEPFDNTLLEEGLVLAYEPFVSTRTEMAYEMEDGWTLATTDGSWVAQIEHTIIVTKNGPVITTE
ncbi:type I methionyl aminopeptidase [Fictibacillus iocasae]|uniref:Methionine aminopeptidase n=1 Tax=Fictibacillus iocasae TaxID=2715437 RepID=A0ABW2NRD6_9BACL